MIIFVSTYKVISFKQYVMFLTFFLTYRYFSFNNCLYIRYAFPFLGYKIHCM